MLFFVVGLFHANRRFGYVYSTVRLDAVSAAAAVTLTRKQPAILYNLINEKKCVSNELETL